jgi:hypothetical protein
MAHNFPRDKHGTRRGGRYDGRHQRARAAAAQRHNPSDPCTRCHQPLGPMGPHLHYDHTNDGTAYLGFAHATCNRRAGAIEGNRRQHATHTPPRWSSRKW